MRTPLALLAAVAALAALPSGAPAAGVAYPDGDWSQASIAEPDGTVLHADVLRPKGATDADKTPVILSIGPYFNHSGQTSAAGPVEGTSFDPVGPSAGPSERFADFVEGSHLLQRGYSFVMVDLRGFGGSSGCLDWGGPGEQADVKAAVEWAAAQPWSTGAVGTYGKSYDAMTGLIATALHPDGLKAVVAQEPVYDDYRYLYGDGMRRGNSLETPALYDLMEATPGPVGDTPSNPTYNVNGSNSTARPGCEAGNWADQAANDDHYSSYWRQRNFIPKVKGSTVPLFITQGTTENNTVADGLQQFLANHDGPERGWIGPWEHVRGNETCAKNDSSTGCDSSNVGRLKMGRAGWFDEVMSFYDQYLKGIAPTTSYPNFAVQDNTGTWRAEQQWPPADVRGYTTQLTPGSYVDDGNGNATGSGSSSGVWTVSPPLAQPVHLAGSPHATVDVSSPTPRSNLVIDVYDVGPDGKGPLVTRQAHLIYANGVIPLHLWSTDWTFPAGHRIAVRVADNNADWWDFTVQTEQTVTVYKGQITLPLLPANHPIVPTQGDPGVQLATYLSQVATMPSAATTAPFALPPAMKARPR
jgi:putative CocE/NonD family hydrolase